MYHHFYTTTKKQAAKKELNIEGIFVAIGMKPDTDIVKEIVSMDESGYIIAGEDGKTSVDGLFVAGDIRKKNLRQLITAVSDGANCAASIEKYLNVTIHG